MQGKEFVIEINPKVPKKLARLEELANNLWYTWDRPTRALFGPLDSGLWRRVGHNPKLFLRRIDEARLQQAAEDQVFLASYNRVLSTYDTYHDSKDPPPGAVQLGEGGLIAYFCAEYGFHESVQIYSGGLGILAGDHCKTASDLRLPFVAVGLLYRMGYFTQTIDDEGHQVATQFESAIDDLPVAPALDNEGNEVHVRVGFPGREVEIKVWQAKAGHITLYLLDTNLDVNSEQDREITHQLYGGDNTMRLQQEMILGIGGVRALRQLGIDPTVWHINEGHSALMVIERMRELMEQGLDLESAREAVAGCTVFTTHTPVPAGHDHFDPDLLSDHMNSLRKKMNVSGDQLLALGRIEGDGKDFNMTTLAIKGSRFQNGVSRLHGEVSSKMLQKCWPEIPVRDNPVAFVTNGVHTPTFLAQEWSDLFDRFLGDAWRNHLSDASFWERLDEIPDHLFWSVNQSIKSQLLYTLRESLTTQHQRNGVNEAHIERCLKYIDPGDPNVLTIGFARRFATYKRATLLFNNLDWLKHLINSEDRPVVIVFAGKAHPADGPGQDLIRRIHEISWMPEYTGKIMLVEGYDFGLARRLTSGVDVWLNNPIHPLEASGTSGMKAAINATLNLSMLDGWWAEAYNGHNGWGIKESPHSDDPERRDAEDARTLYEILQDEVIPLYYNRGGHGYSEGWVKKAKHSMATILPRFNMCRVVNEYAGRFYQPASSQGKLLAADNYANAKALAKWNARVNEAWPGVSIKAIQVPPSRAPYAEKVRMELSVQLNGLRPADVAVELLLSRDGDEPGRVHAGGFTTGEATLDAMQDKEDIQMAYRFIPRGKVGRDGAQSFTLDIQPQWCGRLKFRVRVFPIHPVMTHPHETGLMIWLNDE